jgi:hypothetical protein
VRTLLRLLLALLASALLAGCVSIPATGPVVEGRPAGEPVPPPNVAVLPAGPRPDDPPVAVVEGFLSAMASYEPGYPSARQFLTPSAAASWQPESGIAVYGAGEGDRQVSSAGNQVRTVVPLVARVDDEGSYRPAAPEARLALDFTLEQVDGQWRIATPPAGVVMTSFDFNREYAAYATYFFAPSADVLVPDLTYLPVRGNLPTLLAQRLLDGPTRWLRPAVRTAFGPGVELASGTVPLAGTVAQVDLTAQVEAASAQQRDRLAAQLAWTLQQAPGVTDVAVLAEGDPLPLPGSDTGVVSVDAFAFLDPADVPAGRRLFAVADGAVAEVGENGSTPVPGELGDPLRFRSVGVNTTGTRAAAVSADGSTLSVAGLAADAASTQVVVGTDLAAPVVDRQDRVWVVDRQGARSRVLIVDGGAEAVAVPTGRPRGRQLELVAIAPDGVRVAAVLTSGARRVLAVGLVLEQNGPRLGRWRQLAIDQVEPLDVAWASATALAVLGADAASGAQPYLVELSNAELSSRGQVDGATSLAASPGQALVLGTDEGQLLRQDALQEWEPVVQAEAPTYPG